MLMSCSQCVRQFYVCVNRKLAAHCLGSLMCEVLWCLHKHQTIRSCLCCVYLVLCVYCVNHNMCLFYVILLFCDPGTNMPFPSLPSPTIFPLFLSSPHSPPLFLPLLQSFLTPLHSPLHLHSILPPSLADCSIFIPSPFPSPLVMTPRPAAGTTQGGCDN